MENDAHSWIIVDLFNPIYSLFWVFFFIFSLSFERLILMGPNFGETKINCSAKVLDTKRSALCLSHNEIKEIHFKNEDLFVVQYNFK